MELDQLFEIAHILAGPILGIVITVLAFKDDSLILGKLKELFKIKKTPQDLAESIEDIVSGSVALATFLGNVYLFIFNSIIALIVFPRPDLNIVIISLVGGIGIVGQTIYIFRKYGADIGEFCPWPRITEMRYPEFLRWEQVVLNILTVIYFSVGIYLKYGAAFFQ